MQNRLALLSVRSVHMYMYRQPSEDYFATEEDF